MTSVTSTTTGRVTYAVGDFVYFDDPSALDAPYQIRKIDELVKTDKGSVDARCVIYLRRRDIPQHLLKIADQAQRRFDNYYEVDKKKPENFSSKGFIVANGQPEVKEEDPDDDGPPKIDQEEMPAPIDQGRTSSGEDDEKAPEDIVKEDDTQNLKEKAETEAVKMIDWGDGGLPLGIEKLTKEQRLRLRQHEIFMTRQSEILPASLIRGKCRVVLLGDCEDAEAYLPNEDTFYHSLVFDPNQQTLLADKGAIRVGGKYQAEVDEWMEPEEREAKEKAEQEAKELEEKIKKEEEEERKRQEKADEDADNGKDGLTIDEDEEMPEAPKEEEEEVKKKVEEEATKKDSREVAVWHPHHGLRDRDIDQYLIIARSVGLFARAIDGASTPKLPTLQLAAAFASRDVTILHAHAILHQADYDVGQAVKYLVPIASREAYPCQVDDVSGLNTKTLGGPILCRDQLEEWSTPEMNLFEDGLDKCGKDFNEIRADYLPWKSIRDIVEYYYLMKASNRYTDRKKAKPQATSSDEKFTNIYIPPFNKAIPASVLPFNVSQNLVRSEIPCENCGTLDGINWYQWGGVEKKVLCSSCWTKWKKFGGLDQKHELERFDKTRPPVLDQPSAPGSNGSDRPPVLQQQQQKPSTPTNYGNNQGATPQMRAANQLLNVRGGPTISNTARQNLIQVARDALARGQITQEQFHQLSKNFALHAVQPAAQQQQNQVAVSSGPQKRKVTPATKAVVVFYTNICRRALRRLLPKSAFNLRKLSRQPTVSIDEEKILKAISVIMIDKKTLLQSAYVAAGEKRNLVVESDFHKGTTHLQHTLSAAVTGKRTASSGAVAGEPAAKMAKLSLSSSFSTQQPQPHHQQQLQHQTAYTVTHGPVPFVRPPRPGQPGPSSNRLVAPSLEDVGNTLLAVNQAMKMGRVGPISTATANQSPLLRHFLTQGIVPSSQQPQQNQQLYMNLPRVPQKPVVVLPRIIIPTYKQRIRKLLRTKTDSRWFEIQEEDVKLRVGPRLKTKRRELMSRRQVHHVARKPCKYHEFLEPYNTILYPHFLKALTPPPPLNPAHLTNDLPNLRPPSYL
uniref:ELM2 domain-containing protein n=1 Tax=Caenorhabditis tropicalis TaxID=1561998 RepID=A0A1I7UBA2_9PELO